MTSYYNYGRGLSYVSTLIDNSTEKLKILQGMDGPIVF